MKKNGIPCNAAYYCTCKREPELKKEGWEEQEGLKKQSDGIAPMVHVVTQQGGSGLALPYTS